MRHFTKLLVLFSFISIGLKAQIDFDKISKQKLFPTFIDSTSEAIIVINKKHAILYFRQADVMSYLKPYNVLGVRIDANHESLKSLLSQKSTKIVLKDYWFDYSDVEREKLFGDKDYLNSDKKYLDELYFVAADLIHDGKFMVLDRKTKKIITKNLRMKRINGLMGTRYIEFQLPNRDSFWNIITRLGE